MLLYSIHECVVSSVSTVILSGLPRRLITCSANRRQHLPFTGLFAAFHTTGGSGNLLDGFRSTRSQNTRLSAVGILYRVLQGPCRLFQKNTPGRIREPTSMAGVIRESCVLVISCWLVRFEETALCSFFFDIHRWFSICGFKST